MRGGRIRGQVAKVLERTLDDWRKTAKLIRSHGGIE